MTTTEKKLVEKQIFPTLKKVRKGKSIKYSEMSDVWFTPAQLMLHYYHETTSNENHKMAIENYFEARFPDQAIVYN